MGTGGKVANGRCVCGHPWSKHTHPPDFGCDEEKNGCDCVGYTTKTGPNAIGKEAAAFPDTPPSRLTLMNAKDAKKAAPAKSPGVPPHTVEAWEGLIAELYALPYANKMIAIGGIKEFAQDNFGVMVDLSNLNKQQFESHPARYNLVRIMRNYPDNFIPFVSLNDGAIIFTDVWKSVQDPKEFVESVKRTGTPLTELKGVWRQQKAAGLGKAATTTTERVYQMEAPKKKETEAAGASWLLEPKEAAVNYEEMFKALTDLNTAPDLKKKIVDEIAWAKRVLKKSAWVVWYLRWSRCLLIGPEEEKTSHAYEGGLEIEKKIKEVVKKWRYEAFSKSGDTTTQQPSIGELKWQLEHFLGTPAPAIQEFRPTYDSPRDVVAKLREFEEAYQKETKESIKPRPEDNDSVFIQFPDGWAWWLLPRAACDVEAKAMGHCGNSPDRNNKNMSILSLRQPKKVGKEQRWEPHCTFILHRIGGEDTGTLGEMKGKNNAKPVPRYHPYIIALLEDERIVGMDGGGYKPENNFSPKDLTPEQRDAIEEINPDSMTSLKEYYRANGLDSNSQARIAAKLGVNDDWTDNGLVLRRWETVTDFLKDSSDKDAQKLEAYLSNGSMELFVDNMLDKVDETDGEEELPLFKGIADQFNIEFPGLITKAYDEPSPGHSYAELVEQKKGVDLGDTYKLLHTLGATSIPDESSSLRQNLEAAFIASLPEETWRDLHDYYSAKEHSKLQQLLWHLIDSCGQDSNTRISYDGNGIVECLDDESAADDAVHNRGAQPDTPYVSADLKVDVEMAIQELNKYFDPALHEQERNEEHGQQRLFDRPDSDEEAEAAGIKVSWLLEPKKASKIAADNVTARLETPSHKANVRLDYDRVTKHWLVCAFEKTRPHPGGSAVVPRSRLSSSGGHPPPCGLTSIVAEKSRHPLLQPKTAVNVSDFGREYMEMSGDEIVEEVTIGDYELFVMQTGIIPDLYQIGMQRVGMDAFSLEQQSERQPGGLGRGSLKEMARVINGWIAKYGALAIASHNPEKTAMYTKLAKILGYEVKNRNIMGMQVPCISGTSKRAALGAASQDRMVEYRTAEVVKSDMDWTACTEVERIPGKVSGAPILKHSRVPAAAIADNYQAGVTPAQIAGMFRVPLRQVKSTLAFAFPKEVFGSIPVDWTGCSEVEREPNKLQGAPVLKGSRVQADAIIESYMDGMTLAEISDWFEIPVSLVQSVVDFALPQVGENDEDSFRSRRSSAVKKVFVHA